LRGDVAFPERPGATLCGTNRINGATVVSEEDAIVIFAILDEAVSQSDSADILTAKLLLGKVQIISYCCNFLVVSPDISLVRSGTTSPTLKTLKGQARYVPGQGSGWVVDFLESFHPKQYSITS